MKAPTNTTKKEDEKHSVRTFIPPVEVIFSYNTTTHIFKTQKWRFFWYPPWCPFLPPHHVFLSYLL